MGWRTVPNIFPEYAELSSEARYHLFEGYGVGRYKTKPSGKMYKKVQVEHDPSGDKFHRLLLILGFANWHNKFCIRNLSKHVKVWRRRCDLSGKDSKNKPN